MISIKGLSFSRYLQNRTGPVVMVRPLSIVGHVESQGIKKLCFCTASLCKTQIQCEACRANKKLFILLKLNMAAE